MSLSIFDWNKFSPSFLGQGIAGEIALSIGSIGGQILGGRTLGSLINNITPTFIKRALQHTGHFVGTNITGPVVSKMKIAGVINDFILAPVFEELVFRGGIQQSLIVSLETALTLAGMNHSLALTTAKTISVALTAHLFAVSHEPFNGESLETPGSSARFIRALVRGAIVENGTIYEAIGMHIVNNFIAHIYQRVVLVHSILEDRIIN